jgi:hypothetical protein
MIPPATARSGMGAAFPCLRGAADDGCARPAILD